MNLIAVIAGKEFRAYFQSAVALIFLGVFLLATFFSFFGYSGFFARNLADVRPLFACGDRFAGRVHVGRIIHILIIPGPQDVIRPDPAYVFGQ